MTLQTDSYAVCEIVLPLETRDTEGFTQYAFIVRERGNNKRMQAVRKSHGIGSGWTVFLTDTPVGGKVYAGAGAVPKALLMS